jgi:hypothetical protein
MQVQESSAIFGCESRFARPRQGKFPGRIKKIYENPVIVVDQNQTNIAHQYYLAAWKSAKSDKRAPKRKFPKRLLMKCMEEA